MLETTSDAALGARRSALRLAGQASGARGSRRSTRPGERAVPFTSGILIGIGETRAERLDALLALRDAARAARPRPGGDRPELPREAGDEDGGRIRSRRSTSSSGRRPSRGSSSGRRRERPGAAEPLVRRLPAPARRRDRRLGRHLAGDARPREPGGAVARDRAAARGDGGGGPRAGAAAAALPASTSRDLDRWTAPQVAAGRPPPLGRERPRPGGHLGGRRGRPPPSPLSRSRARE